ncbi:MAG: hypothetical protein MZV63_26815 [Marinilabiliales bacterium]|nr:hypothetical protein [Marinilabiliales bacterium]
MGEKILTPLVIQKAESSGRQKSIENLARALYPEPENTLHWKLIIPDYKITSVTSVNNTNVLNYCFTSGLVIGQFEPGFGAAIVTSVDRSRDIKDNSELY